MRKEMLLADIALTSGHIAILGEKGPGKSYPQGARRAHADLGERGLILDAIGDC